MPSSETFIEAHKNVSILYADICGFTPLTTKFLREGRIQDLVATLNDLFGKFDDAAEVGNASIDFGLINVLQKHNCLRIKILGDCYYCISGLPGSGAEGEGGRHAVRTNLFWE